MSKFLKRNGLSVVLFLLFIGSWIGQAVTGFVENNKERTEEGASPIPFSEYMTSGHFVQATFENWESEFLQMALFVILTIFLQQKGSSESKDFDKEEEVDREPSPDRKNAPWPVKMGGLTLEIYKYSLTIVLFLLFAISFTAHFYGSLNDENDLRRLKGEPLETASKYIGDTRFWFESFQNWQSEFFSIFAIILLSIHLRQKGSPQSKPVDAPTDETGE